MLVSDFATARGAVCAFETRRHVAIVIAELARTNLEQQRGLQLRQFLEPENGMLFIFPEPAPIKFWMKDTFIPLDMIFADDTGRVVFVEEDAQPLSLLLRGPDEPTQFVVEVPSGWARAHSVENGSHFSFRLFGP